MNPAFLKQFSSYANGSPLVAQDPVIGLLHPRQEINALLPVLTLTGKSTGVTFNFGEPDLDTLVAAFISKLRATWMGITDAVQIAPDVARDFAQYGLGEDLWQLQSIARVGAAVPATGGAANVYRIPLAIPFINIQKEYASVNAFSSGQLWFGSRVEIDLVTPVPVLPLTVVLPNGSIQITAVSVELWALTGSIRKILWMSPASKMFTRPVNGIQFETEGGPTFDEMVMSLVDAASYPNAADNVTITTDGQVVLPPTPIANLPLGYSASVKANETAVPSYDVAQNSKARLAAPRTGRVPLIYIPGLQTPVEKEWPAFASSRQINFGQKVTAAGVLAFWRQTPITSQENMQHLGTMLGDVRLQPQFTEKTLSQQQIDQIKRLQFGDLAIDGGGSSGPGAMNSDLAMWKPRLFAPRRGK